MALKIKTNVQSQQEYCDEMENVNLNNLNRVNNQLHWFKEIIPSVKYNHSDATCYTKDGRKITVELKTRNETIKQLQKWGGVFIEPKKISHFTDVMESGFTLNENCLFVNFCPDGVIIFSFNDLKEPLQILPNHRQRNPKNNFEFEHETRFSLNLKDAIIYKYDIDGELYRFK